jgi:hypothetical protein
VTVLTIDELTSIRSRLTALRERLTNTDDDSLVEVQWLQDAERDFSRLLAETKTAAKKGKKRKGQS